MYSLSEKTAFEQVSIKSIETFCNKFKVGSALKKSNAYKRKDVPTLKLIKYLSCLVFFGRSLFQDLRSKTPYASDFGKDTVYRFMNESTFNWQTFVLIIALKVTNFFNSLTSDERQTALIIDDSVYDRPHSKKMELSSRVYDHADGKNKFKTGFRMLTLGWTDGFSFVPLAFRHLASSDKKNRYQEADSSIDRRTNGGKLRKEAVMKGYRCYDNSS